ncbi:MAG: hypothetical protein WD995_08800 [Gemmatimonadota bacterium]
MTMPLESWLAKRHPPAVMSLDPWTAAYAEEGPEGRVRTLSRLAVKALGSTRARPGRVRDSAFELLAADALLTYACEAALETEDVEEALLGVLGSVSER